MVVVAQEITEMIGLFSEIAQTDIVSASLLGVGSVLLGLSVVVFGVLTVGAILNGFTHHLRW